MGAWLKGHMTAIDQSTSIQQNRRLYTTYDFYLQTDLDGIGLKMNQHASYLPQRLLRSKVIVQTHGQIYTLDRLLYLYH